MSKNAESNNMMNDMTMGDIYTHEKKEEKEKKRSITKLLANAFNRTRKSTNSKSRIDSADPDSSHRFTPSITKYLDTDNETSISRLFFKSKPKSKPKSIPIPIPKTVHIPIYGSTPIPRPKAKPIKIIEDADAEEMPMVHMGNFDNRPLHSAKESKDTYKNFDKKRTSKTKTNMFDPFTAGKRKTKKNRSFQSKKNKKNKRK